MKKGIKNVEQKTSKLAIVSLVLGIIKNKLKIIIILFIIIGLIIFFYPKPSEYGCGKEYVTCICMGIEIEKDIFVKKDIIGERLDCLIFNDCYGLSVGCKVTGLLTLQEGVRD